MRASRQLRLVPDARLHQQLGRMNRTEGQNHFARGLYAKRLPLVLELDADCAATVKSNSRRQRPVRTVMFGCAMRG